MESWLIREGMSLRPFGRESAELLSKLPHGKPLFAEVRQPRNGKHHRLFWSLCHRIGESVGSDGDAVAHVLKLRTGHCREIRTKRGVELMPLSISFAKMDQTDFSKFFDKCLDIITSEWGIARPDVLDAIKDLIEPDAA